MNSFTRIRSYKNMKKIVLMAVAVLSLAACSKDKASQSEIESNPTTISFKTAGTKGTELTAAPDEFWVSAYAAGYGTAGNGIYIDNQKYVKSANYAANGLYVGDGGKYYSWLGPNVDINFMAYTADALAGGSVVFKGAGDIATYDEATSARGIKDFQVAGAIKDQKDVVVAMPVDGTTGAIKGFTAGPVALTFNHALCQIEVKAKTTVTGVAATDKLTYEITGVRIGCVPSKGDYILTGPNKGTWTNAEKSTFSYEFEAGENPVTLDGDVSTDGQSVMGNCGVAMLIPTAKNATLTPWSAAADRTNNNDGAFLAVKVKVSMGGVKIFPKNTDYGWAAVALLDKNGAEQSWEAGKKYTYTIDFTNGPGRVAPDAPFYGSRGPGDFILSDDDDITFSVSVGDWDVAADKRFLAD